MLSLHAFFGLKMNNGPMACLRRDSASQPEALFALYSATQSFSPPARPELLTSQACELCREPLDEGLFFGRAEALACLRRQIQHGGKILVSGMGGIGKTELVRQALKTLLREGLFTRVAFIQYQDNLVESFLRSFLNLHANTPQARYEECLARLSQGSGRALLLVDNMNTAASGDAALHDLAGLGCDVVMTSRLASLSGFRVFALDAPENEAAGQIFTAHYGRPLTPEEQPLLDHLIEEHLGAHPLSCMVMGSLARARHMDIPTLYNALSTKGLKGSFVQEARSVQVEDVLRQLYNINNLDAASRRLLRLFALLPQRLYPFSNLQELLADITKDRDSLADSLESLCYLGWLRGTASGYAMHPVIAETLLEDQPRMAEYPLFWAFLDSRIQSDKFREWAYINIAQHALQHSDTHSSAAQTLLLNTAILIMEQSMLSAAERLVAKAWSLAEDPALATPEYLYTLHAVCLNLLRAGGRFDGAEKHIREILRLFPRSGKASNRPFALSNALFFAVNLALKEEALQLVDLLETTPWQGVQEKALQCYGMAEFHSYTTRNSHEVLRWAEEGLALLSGAGLLNTLEAANLYHAKALGCAYSARPQEARANFSAFKQIYRNWFGDSDALVFALADNTTGIAYDQAGDYDNALKYLFRSLKRIRGISGADSHLTESYLNNISNAFLHKGDFEQALTYAQEAYQMHRRLNKVENLQTSLLINNMGCILRDSGRYEQAQERLTEALRIAALLAGEDSIPYAEPCFNLGRLFLLMGDPAQAASWLQRAVPLFEQGYGPEHPRTLMARGKLQEALAT